MLMFDSLNRRFLPNFGCDWTKMPNFQRLAEKTLTFDNFYGASMPCMGWHYRPDHRLDDR